jgi:hypothetical protein
MWNDGSVIGDGHAAQGVNPFGTLNPSEPNFPYIFFTSHVRAKRK